MRVPFSAENYYLLVNYILKAIMPICGRAIGKFNTGDLCKSSHIDALGMCSVFTVSSANTTTNHFTVILRVIEEIRHLMPRELVIGSFF
jgi:hypothetical protein